MPVRLLLAALLAATAAAADDAGLELARRVDQRQAAVRDLTARFEQRYRSGTLGRELVERGTLAIRRPGRMRWEYREPERKTFVADGRNFYFYVPADKQVVVREQGADRGLVARLLSGRGGIVGQFDVTLDRSASGRARLLLTPRDADPDVARISIEPDDSDRIQVLELVDTQGNRSEFRFEGVRENVGLPDRLFRFEIPKGVEVLGG